MATPLAKSTQLILSAIEHYALKVKTAARQIISFVLDKDTVGKIFVNEQIVRQLDGLAEVKITRALHERQAVLAVNVPPRLLEDLIRIQLGKALH